MLKGVIYVLFEWLEAILLQLANMMPLFSQVFLALSELFKTIGIL